MIINKSGRALPDSAIFFQIRGAPVEYLLAAYFVTRLHHDAPQPLKLSILKSSPAHPFPNTAHPDFLALLVAPVSMTCGHFEAGEGTG